jgi:antirestriction protein ArdC
VTEHAGFGSDPYCREELIAEIGAAFLCGQAEIAERTIDNSAAYVAEWLKRLKDDKKLVVQAAAQAQRAADFVLGRTYEEEAHD